LAVGLLFGLSAIVSMSFHILTTDGQIIDARTVFVFIGSLYGGPIGSVVAATMAIAYRLILTGPGKVAGIAAILVAAGFGAAVAVRYRDRVHDMHGYELLVVGFANTVLAVTAAQVTRLFQGEAAFSRGLFIGALIVFPVGTLLLGSAMGMIHRRLWSSVRQRLADIIETTTDVIWETDIEGRLTFLSDRHREILDQDSIDYLGRKPEEIGSLWIDETTKHAAETAREARLPFSNLAIHAPARDGDIKILSVNGRPSFDARGRFIGYRGTAQDITERAQMEAKLLRSNAQLIRAQKIGGIGSGEWDLRTGASEWSEEMYAMMGLDPAAGAGLERLARHIHPDDRQRYCAERQFNECGGVGRPIEFRFIRPDGETRWFHREAQVERDAEGRAVKLFTTLQDVTEARKVEDALRESRDANARSLRTLRMLSDCNQLLIHATGEAQLEQEICRTICETGAYALAWVGHVRYDVAKSTVPLAAYGKDGAGAADDYVQTMQISWDEAVERGRGPMGRAIRSGRVVVEHNIDSAPEFAPWRERALARGIRSTISIPLRDGQRVFAALCIYSTATDVLDTAEIELMEELGSNLAYGIIGLRNRAARESAERELSATQDALRAIMDHTVDGLITIDEHGTILTFSRPAESIFGVTAEEVIGGNVSILMPPSYDGRLDPDIRHLLGKGHLHSNDNGRELAGRRADGSVFPMDFHLGEIPGGASGRRFVVTVRDIAERKETEAQLRQAQKMEAMGQLTGGVAHDFNNLLAVILGRLQMLEEELGDKPQLQGWARSGIKALERGATLTKSLLAFARQQALVPIELDLNAVVTDMEEMLQRVLGEKYEFRVIKGADLWSIEADSGQLQNALLNLALNARDAMPDGGKLTINVSNTELDADYAATHRDVRPGDYVLMSVSDTGVGMSQDVIDRAFEPFFTTKETGKGSGLGLSMVYGFMKQTGGHVAIYSEPGYGTDVRVYLRRKVGEVDGAVAAPVASENEVSVVGGNETILVIEDNEDLRELTRVQLQRLGYLVLDATDGAEGLNLLAAHPEIKLLLTDVILPRGMNGPILAERARETLPALEVIFMSGYNEQHDEIANARIGRPLRLLQKPFHVEALADQIRAALDGHGGASNPSQAA
jgi:PAS domain S-box-containing protein